MTYLFITIDLRIFLTNQKKMEAFQVFARIRPLNQKETNFYSGKMAAYQVDECTLAVGDTEMRETQFQVDQVFGEEITNQDIFENSLESLVSNFLGGVNSTVFAYGITGAGKSHTMFGSQGENWQAGLIQLTLQYLFGEIPEIGSAKVGLSYMEIYNEQVFDLLRPKSQSLQILDDPVLGVVVNDLQEVEIHSSRSAQALIELGNTRRMVAETKANEFSSRSHAIVQITIERAVDDKILTAKLSLVDLAGSQRQTVYSDQKGIRNLEGSNINRSLLTLGNCITALSQRKKGSFVPYRDSKLTRLLKDSLGGNTKTMMIACISPSILSYDQTLNTMKYACRARKIQKVVYQNIRDTRSNQDLRKEIGRLKRELEEKEVREDIEVNTITKEQMQDFVHRLMKNVENLTLVRVSEDLQIENKMREIELIEEQRIVIGSMLSRCPSDQRDQKEMTRSKTAELFPERRPKMPKSMSFNQLQQTKKVRNSLKMNLIPQLQQQYEMSSIQPPSGDFIKGTAFIRGNLENVRLKHKEEKKIIKELASQYINLEDQDEEREDVIDRARQLLFLQREEDHFLGGEDRKILEKIVREEKLDRYDLAHYHLKERVPELVIDEDRILFKEQNLPLKQPNNRFLSSLQQIRRMMRRVSGTINKVQQQEMRFDSKELDYLNYSKQLLFDQ